MFRVIGVLFFFFFFGFGVGSFIAVMIKYLSTL